MAGASRAKGIRGEREVRDAFEQVGFSVRGLEGEGDHLCLTRDGLVIHSEVKRAERLRLPEWSRQAETEAPAGAIPCVIYRANREPWRVSMPLLDFFRAVTR